MCEKPGRELGQCLSDLISFLFVNDDIVVWSDTRHYGEAMITETFLGLWMGMDHT